MDIEGTPEECGYITIGRSVCEECGKHSDECYEVEDGE